MKRGDKSCHSTLKIRLHLFIVRIHVSLEGNFKKLKYKRVIEEV